MRLILTWYTMGWIALASVALGRVAADEPKAKDSAATKQLQGSWRPESVTEGGRRLSGANLEGYKGMTLSIEKEKSTLKAADGTVLSACELKVDVKQDPKTFDAKEVEGLGVGRTYKGIWEVEGDTLKWCFSTTDRPKGFEIKEEADFFMLVLKRKTAMEQVRGSWRPDSVTEAGRQLTGANLDVYKGMTLTIEKEKSTLKSVDGSVLSACELKLDAKQDPKTFDAKEVEGLGVGRTYKGVWEVEGDTLKWCFSTKDRPKGFESKDDADFFLLILKRQKPK